MTQLITIEQVREVAKRLPENATNPGGGCRYTVGDEHCVAGQILVELGLPCPGDGDGRGFSMLDQAERFTEEARRAVTYAQSKADLGCAWGDALRHAGLLGSAGLLDPAPSEGVDKP